MKSRLLNILPILGFVLLPGAGHAQPLSGAVTRWSDSFREWVLTGPEREEIGNLALRWSSGNDWTDYRLSLYGYSGQVRLKWPNRTDEWELRLGQEIVTIRAVFPGDPTEWRVLAPGIQLTFKARFPNQREGWALREDSHGQFFVYTAWEGDPREWIIENDLITEKDSPAIQAALLFIALIQSSPKI